MPHLSLLETFSAGLHGLRHVAFAGSRASLLMSTDSSVLWELDWQSRRFVRCYRPPTRSGRRLSFLPGGQAQAPLNEPGLPLADEVLERQLGAIRALGVDNGAVWLIDANPDRQQSHLVSLASGQRDLIASGRNAFTAARSTPLALIALGDNQRVALLRWPERRLAGELAGHKDGVRDMVFSPDGRHLLSVGIESEDVQHRDAACLWDVQTLSEVWRFMWHHLGSVAFHPSGRVVALGCAAPAAIKLWQPETDHMETDETAAPLRWVSALAFSDDGGALCAANYEGELMLFSYVD